MYKIVLFAVAGFFLTAVTLADDRPLDVTISVVRSPHDLPAAVTKTIELPAAAADIAREHSSKGLSTANQAREDGRAFGQSIADEAKTRRKGKGKP
jgi:hypothetical protein